MPSPKPCSGIIERETWNSMKSAIAQAHSVMELKTLADRAKAYRYALRLAKEAPDGGGGQVVR